MNTTHPLLHLVPCLALAAALPAWGADSAPPAGAHPESLDHGGFGGPTLGTTHLRDSLVPTTGGRGGWIVDHRYVVGGALAAVPQAGGWGLGDQQTRFWQGGLLLERRFRPRQPLHYSLGAVLGCAWFERGPERVGSLLAEPVAAMGLELTFFQADLAVGYRLTGGEADLDGVTVAVHLAFGSF